MPKSILVRRYKNSGRFEKDANHQFDMGYEIIEVNGQRPSTAIVRGTLGFAMTGGLGFLIGGRAHKKDPILVTYRYAGPIEAVTKLSRRARMSQPAQVLVFVLIVVLFAGLAYATLH